MDEWEQLVECKDKRGRYGSGTALAACCTVLYGSTTAVRTYTDDGRSDPTENVVQDPRPCNSKSCKIPDLTVFRPPRAGRAGPGLEPCLSMGILFIRYLLLCRLPAARFFFLTNAKSLVKDIFVDEDRLSMRCTRVKLLYRTYWISM